MPPSARKSAAAIHAASSSSSSHGKLAPALTRASTPAEPSAFMTTTDQLPSLTFQSSGLLPSPVAAQKSWSAGRAGAEPRVVR